MQVNIFESTQTYRSRQKTFSIDAMFADEISHCGYSEMPTYGYCIKIGQNLEIDNVLYHIWTEEGDIDIHVWDCDAIYVSTE